MGMKIGLAGFSGSGKSTVFEWLTGVKPDPSKIQAGQTGVAKVPDSRLDWLSSIYKPKKTTPTTIDFLDTPGLLPTERRDNPRRLSIMREAGGLIIVLNGFGANQLADELRLFREELVFADLEIITNRVEKLQTQLKKPRPAKQKELDEAELALLLRITGALEKNQMPASLGLRDDEEKAIRSFQLLTLKPQLALVNCNEEKVGKPLPADLLALDPNTVLAPAKIEMELQDLSEEDRAMFMQDMGLTGSCRDDVIRAIFKAMGMIVFITVGPDECRTWNLREGADAVEAAGQIHTDLAHNFVRARVVAYDDFHRVGSHKEARSQGLERLEGKTYAVKDGDIMEIL